MKSSSPWSRLILFAAVGVATAIWFVVHPLDPESRPDKGPTSVQKGGDTPSAAPNQEGPGNPHSAGKPKAVLDGIVVRSYGRKVYQGRVDLSATIARIRRGESFGHRNDGKTFHNREKRLPIRPRHYYKEYVHPTPGLKGPGPQRLVVGRGGEWYYTPDHYRSFVPLTRRARPPP